MTPRSFGKILSYKTFPVSILIETKFFISIRIEMIFLISVSIEIFILISIRIEIISFWTLIRIGIKNKIWIHIELWQILLSIRIRIIYFCISIRIDLEKIFFSWFRYVLKIYINFNTYWKFILCFDMYWKFMKISICIEICFKFEYVLNCEKQFFHYVSKYKFW